MRNIQYFALFLTILFYCIYFLQLIFTYTAYRATYFYLGAAIPNAHRHKTANKFSSILK